MAHHVYPEDVHYLAVSNLPCGKSLCPYLESVACDCLWSSRKQSGPPQASGYHEFQSDPVGTLFGAARFGMLRSSSFLPLFDIHLFVGKLHRLRLGSVATQGL
jgi:hypothetical protein